MPFNLICNMTITTFSKRYSLTFWPHPLGQGCVCGQNICYHVAASVISFNLICNMTTFRKIYSLTFWPHPLGRGCVCGQNICYHVAASIVGFNLICNMTIFWKSLILASAPPPKFTQGVQTKMDGQTHGRRQNYIPPTLSGDNKTNVRLASKQWQVKKQNSYAKVLLEKKITLIVQHNKSKAT